MEDDGRRDAARYLGILQTTRVSHAFLDMSKHTARITPQVSQNLKESDGLEFLAR